MMTDAIAALPDWQAWLALGLLLGIAEIVMPGIFLIWIATAAVLTGIAALLLPFPVSGQIVLFAALCIGATWAGRKLYARDPGASQDPLLNDRTARLVGELVTVSEPIHAGRGKVRVGDSEWLCRGDDCEAGSQVRVTGAQGAVLIVEPVTG